MVPILKLQKWEQIGIYEENVTRNEGEFADAIPSPTVAEGAVRR